MRNPILNAGLIIGVLCGIWTFVMGFTGWYRDPAMMPAFFLVIPIEIGGLVWGLRRTAAQGRGYAGQIVAGTLMAVVAGVIIMVSSLLFTTVVFPGYFTELEAVHRSLLERQGMTDPEIAEALRTNMAAQTPMAQALAGFLGTFITGILASAVIAIPVRARHAARSGSPPAG